MVLVTLDTTRADRIGAYGYAGAHTDTLDAIAADGVRFANAISPLPLTIPAHATLFTGLYPFHHHVRANGDNVLAESFTTLAERFKQAGYATGASVAAFVTTRQWGFSQGFDAYFDQMPEPEEGSARNRNFWHTERSGDVVVDDAIAWLSTVSAEEPVFLWVHLYDAHLPYAPRGEWADKLEDRPYDGELAFVDDQVARLRDALVGRDVIWSLVGDHGEALGEHGESTHGLYAYQATQHVPWILAGPGLSPSVYEPPVSTACVAPTLLRLAGLAVPDGLDGVPQPGTPMVPYSESYQLADRFRLAPHRSVVDHSLKLIATPKPELYDLQADPGEEVNLADQRQEDVVRLTKALDELHADPPSSGAASMDAATLQQLAALGYVSGGGGAGVDYANLPDPKDYAQVVRAAEHIDQIVKNRGPQGALDLIDDLLAAKPDLYELRMRKTQLLAQAGQADKARGFVEETARLFPGEARPWVMLAGMSMAQGDVESARTFAESALSAQPQDSNARETWLDLNLRAKDPTPAVTRAKDWMAENPNDAGVAALLGRYYLRRQEYPDAERYLRIAVSSPNPRAGARLQLAMLAKAADAKDDAIALLLAEVKDYPGNLLARRALSAAFAGGHRWLEQREHAEFIARTVPTDPRAQLDLAQCQFNLKEYAAARKALDRALALAPADPDVLLLHANLLVKEGKRDEGQAAFEKATAANQARAAEQKLRGAGGGR